MSDMGNNAKSPTAPDQAFYDDADDHWLWRIPGRNWTKDVTHKPMSQMNRKEKRAVRSWQGRELNAIPSKAQ